MAANALAGSQLDYCNSCIPAIALDLYKLQCVQNIDTSLLLGRPSNGYLLNTVPYLRLPYWCTSSYIVVIQHILYLSLNLDIVLTHIRAKLMVCSLRSHTLPLQYTNILSILASALLMMLQRFGIICLMMYIQPLPSTHSERSSKPISLHKYTHPNFCFSQFLSMVPTPAMSQVNDYSVLLFLFGAPRVCM